MKTCVLHVGLHKTGSTSIQRSLHAGVAGSSYRYFSFGQVNGSMGLRTIFGREPETYHVFKRQDWPREKVLAYRRDLTTQLDDFLSTSDGNIILSGEDVSTLNVQELTGLRGFLEQRGFSIDVIVYLRPWHSRMESAVQEMVKHGDVNLLKSMSSSGYFLPDFIYHLSYQGIVESLDSVFGRDHVKVLNFAPSTFPGGCVVRHFCSQLGIDPEQSHIKRGNDALKLPPMQLLYAYRNFGPGQRVGEHAFAENWLLVARLYQLGGHPFRLHSTVMDPLVEPYRSQRLWIEERLGEPFVDRIQDDAPGVIRSEEDLFDFAPEALEWLAAQTDGKPLRHRKGEKAAREVAERMHGLTLSLGRRQRRTVRINRLKALPRILSVKASIEFKRLFSKVD